MDNEILKKRGWLLLLMVASVVLFISLVWIIATRASRGFSGSLGIATTATATLRAEKNCVYPIGYWVAHPEFYPSQIVLGSKIYEKDEISQVLSDQQRDITSQLQAQLIGVFLNILSGADQGVINATIFQSYGWIVDHPAGSPIADADLQTGTRLFNVLEAYNLGLASVVLCQDAATYAVTETSTPTETATIVQNSTPSETPTPSPSPSASPTIEVIYPTWTVAVASPTLTPTMEGPGEPPPATETIAPTREPTDTPEPTIEEPTPTDISEPTETLPPPP